MLEINIYSERSYEREGVTFHVGEDAHPYVNEAGMFVADGLGGGAAIHIDTFPEWCFDPEKLSARICEASGLENRDSKAALAEYVKGNFASLANDTMKKIYDEPDRNRLRLKKSGYVGSHVLGNIMTGHLLKMAENMNEEKEAWESGLREFTDHLPEQFRKEIQRLGSTLEDVRINRGIDYYGTTLAAAFFREKKDTVDVIYINCGDSRSYVLDENGFRQACEDQRRKGIMTTKISLGNRTEVNIAFEKKTYTKPVTIMCVTDGVYEIFTGRNGFQSSPLAMEGYLLKTITASESMEGLKSRLQKTFDERGLIDDSNSMVMASFGYTSYKEFSSAAQKRLDDIDHMYGMSALPADILFENYERKRKALKTEMQKRQAQLVRELFSDRRIHDDCIEKVKSAGMLMRYCPDYTEIVDEIKSLKSNARAVREKCIRLVRYNWLDFVNDGTQISSPTVILPGRNLVGLTNKTLAAGKAYSSDIEERRQKEERLTHLLSTGFAEGVAVQKNMLGSCNPRSSAEYLKELQSIRSRVLTTTEEIIKTMEEIKRLTLKADSDRFYWNEANCKLASTWYGSVAITGVADKLLSGQMRTKSIMPETTVEAVGDELAQYIADYNNITARKERKELELHIIQEMAAEAYWEEYADYSIIKRMYDCQAFEGDSGLSERVKRELEENDELTQCEQMIEKQKALFEKYMDMHLAEMSSEKREDVRKYGWI